MTEEEKSRELLKRYLSGECSHEERASIEKWYDAIENQGQVNVSAEELKSDLNAIQKRLPKIRKKYPYAIGWYAAAAVLLVFGFGALLIPSLLNDQSERPVISIKAADILPGSDKATLTLEDGKVFELDEIRVGDIDHRGVVKDKEGSISYSGHGQSEAFAGSSSKYPQYHTIRTPRGGQYRLTLPDGSRIRLNAASSVRYAPNQFTQERSITLEGEAYFEIQSDPKRPFKVFSQKQTITVLGTKFNVNSYEDEPGTRTTLLEGSVKIEAGSDAKPIILVPGQQAFIDLKNKTQISTVNTDISVAWTNGLFRFQGSSIQEAMRQLSRWYDVDVIFKGQKTDLKLYGEVNRNMTAETPLELLKFFDLEHHIEKKNGKTEITIQQNKKRRTSMP